MKFNPHSFSAPPDITDSASDPWLGIAVRVLIRDDSGRILILQRAQTERFPHQWELPGGKVDPGEFPVDAARRETLEETALEVGITGLIGATEGYHRGARTINLAFHAQPVSGVLALSDEHDAHAWADPALIQTFPLSPDSLAVLDLKELPKLLGTLADSYDHGADGISPKAAERLVHACERGHFTEPAP